MNKEFKILWVEDNIDSCEIIKEGIENILLEYQFLPKIINVRSVQKDSIDYINDIRENSYDLILVDYILSDDSQTGKDIILGIKNNEIYIDTVFYSSDYFSLRNSVNRDFSDLGGIYLCKRENSTKGKMLSTIKNLILKIIKRNENIVGLRGLVLDNTSDFETRIKEIINTCIEKELFNLDYKSMLSNAVEKRHSSYISEYNKYISKKNKDPQYANNQHMLLSIYDKLFIINNIAEENHLECENFNNFEQYYKESLHSYRTPLSHAKYGDKTIRINNQIINIDSNLFKNLRFAISNIDRLLNEIEKLLK